MTTFIVVCDRIMPWALLVALWKLFGPREPFDGSDVVVMVAIATTAIGGWVAFHRATQGMVRERRAS